MSERDLIHREDSGLLWLERKLEVLGRPSVWLIIAWRLVNAFTINTFFQADEYWQALEPAHAMVFGYGYLTWEWKLGLRSFLHPLLYVVPYKFVDYFNLDYTYLLAAPKVVNALVAIIGDYYLYDLIRLKFRNEKLAVLVCYLSLFSAWNWFCWCRSFANSLELTTTIVSLYYLYANNILIALITAALTCLIRPTSAIIWLIVLPRIFWKNPKHIITALVVGTLICSLDFLVNYWFYRKAKFPLLSFFRFNVADSLSSFYGVSRLEFYFLQAIPVITLNYLPFFLYGIAKTSWSDTKFLLLCYILIFSLIPHKEFRFIYPLMPFILTYVAYGLFNIAIKVRERTMKILILISVIISAHLAYYFTQYHEMGELKLPTVIRNKVLEAHCDEPLSVGFLTPCHSTPFQSHIHLPSRVVNVWFLTCEPPLPHNIKPGITLESYMDESDYFYENPLAFIKANFPSIVHPNISPPRSQWPHQWPHYIVMYSSLWESNDDVRNFLGQYYGINEALWNAAGHWDPRREGHLLLLKLL